jgi:ABC-2 type transport system permease protein
VTSDRASLRLVVSREVREALRRRAVWVASLLALLGTTALMIVPELVGSDGHRTVAVVGPAPAGWSEALTAAGADAGLQVREISVDDAADGRAAVDHGRADVAVVMTDVPAVITKDSQSTTVTVVRRALAIQRTASQLRTAGLSEAQIADALLPAPTRVEVVEADRSGRIAAATVASLGVYLLIFAITTAVANGVAIEKSNRVSEVLLAVVPPRVLLFGKVIGIGLVGLIPFVAGAIPVVVKLSAGGSLPPGTGSILAAGAAWFVLGAALYLLVAGALGALVERQEEVGSAMAGLSVLLVSSYIIGQSAAESPLGTVLAYVPFSSPMVEPARLALGASSATEVIVSLAISCIAVVVAARAASVIYRRAIVRTGRRLHVRDLAGVAAS